MFPKIIDRINNKIYTIYALRQKTKQVMEAFIYDEDEGWVWVILDERYMQYEHPICLAKYY